jgi:hypothetical protein
MKKLSQDFLDTFDGLSDKTVQEGAIVAHELPGRSNVFVGKDFSGDILVLFADSESKVLPTKKFKNLRIEYSARYEIEISGTIVGKDFTLLKLLSADQAMKEAFCTLVATFVDSLPQEPTTSEIRSSVDRIVELFLASPDVSKSAIVGLWGELAFITNSEDPNYIAQAWHVLPTAKSDFSLNSHFVEVKTTDGNERAHSLRLHQLSQPEKPIFFASVKLTPDNAGKNLLELLTECISLLTPTNQQHVIEIFFKTIGTNLEETENYRFTLLGGADEIMIFNAVDLPRPEIPSSQAATAIGKVSFELNFDTLISLGVSHSSLRVFSAPA